MRAQLLDSARPTDMLAVIRHLTLLNIDPAAPIAPSVDLVLWSRLGSAYSPADLESALATQTLLDLCGMIRPSEDLVLYRAEMAQWPGRGELREWQEDNRDWVEANEGCRLDILDRLRRDGPLTSRELPDTCVVPWGSSGWTNNRNVTQLLGFMTQRGEVAVAGRDGRDRMWDLAERVYPDQKPVPTGEARRRRIQKQLRSLGIARAKGLEWPSDGADVGEPAVVAGVRGQWRVEPSQLDRPFSGRAALLSPLDLLVFDRKRMTELFEFDYQLEMYKPVAQRKWGYYALPILYGDRLVGKLDATADRKAGVLRVDAIHRDVAFNKTMTAAIRREIDDLADWLKLDLDLPTDH